MTKICPKCKTENSDNADFCQNCGTELTSLKGSVNPNKTSANGIGKFWNDQGKGGKIAIGIGVCCVGLLILFAIGSMVTPDKNTATTTGNAPQSTTQAQTTAPAVTWHSVANFTGSGDKNTPSFTTKGTKFKVVINASTSSPEYALMSFFAYLEGETKSYVGSGDMGTFSQSSQSDEFEVTASPGNYYLSVIAANLNKWHVEVFDYY